MSADQGEGEVGDVMRRWFVGLLIVLASCHPGPFRGEAQAGELFLDLGAGATKFFPTVPEGSWWQEPFPHKFGLTDFAWRAGLGWKFNDRWSITASYIDMGSATSNERQVADEDHDFVHHTCLRNCNHPVHAWVQSHLRGEEASLKYTFDLHPITPFVRVGGALLRDRTTWNDSMGGGYGLLKQSFVATLGGVGICYQWICVETTYYQHITGDNGFTIATNSLVSLLTLNVPIW